jgi:carboxymethylenebutenolidase
MTGDRIEIAAADGGRFDAYLAIPEAGSGPGLVLIQEIFGVNQHMRDVADLYAAEGYVVLCPDLFWRIEKGIELGQGDADQQKAFALFQKFDVAKGVDDVTATVKALRGLKQCVGKIGALGFCLGGKLAYLAAAKSGVDCAVSYYGVGIEQSLALAGKIACPMVMHFAEKDQYVPVAAVEQIRQVFGGRPEIEIYVYPGVDHGFNRKTGAHYDKPAAGMAHSRSIALLRKAMGPRYDLGALWEKHTMYEFGTRDVAATMKTMVSSPYVNHIPTMTGGVGAAELARFYANHFIPKCPKDTKLVPISRTIGADRLVDEMLFCFTHDIEIDWMLPGTKPTGKYVEVPLVAIVNFRGDKLYHEHIYWDQASVLVQIGLIDPMNLPVAGIATAKKLVDQTLPSNTLMRSWKESVA